MSEQSIIGSYEELRYKDDFMFGKIMEDKELCREVLECLLQRPVGELTEIQTQKEFKQTSDGKAIRLDVYNEDSKGRIYDVEMENLNKKTVEAHELPRRSRYYQGLIDTDYMNKGNSYKKLPESSVMFICTFDPFRMGLSKYTFMERCNEEPGLTLDDGTVKIFYNCCYEGEDIPDDLRKFYDYVENGNVESELTKKIDEAVVRGRKNEIWRSQYMKERVILQDAREEGRKEGQDKVVELCKWLFENGRAEDVQKATMDDEFRHELFEEYERVKVGGNMNADSNVNGNRNMNAN